MLESIRVKGYRALKDLQLELPPGRPLVLIGENATGKSTILDAIALICAVANGRIGRVILDRGGWPAAAWAGTATEIELTVRFSKESPTFQREKAPVEYMVRIGTARSVPTVLDEEVRVFKKGLDSKPFVALKGGATCWARNIQTGQDERLTPAISDGSIFVNSTLAAIADEVRYPTPTHVKQALQAIAFYPSFALGGSSEAAEPGHDAIGARPVEWTRRIRGSGRDLLNALHTLSQESAKEWKSLTSDLRAVFPWCGEVRFPPGPGRGLITMSWVDARSGATLYLDDMSEGMRVFLALLAALHAPDAPSLIAFDEPERSLHPRAIRRLVKVLESRAERTPIVVATHADRFLDYLEDPAKVLRVTRFTNADGVALESLDRELLEAWLKDYTLSELRARDLLEAPPAEEGVSSEGPKAP
jgi:predicted ATPase